MEFSASEYEQSFRDAIAESADIEGIAIITADGYHIASVLPNLIGSERAALISSTLASVAVLASSLVSSAGKGHLDQFYIKGIQGYLVMLRLPDEMLLIALCREQAKLGLIFLDISRIFRSGPHPFLSTSEGIIPPHPPGSLDAHAKPDYEENTEV